MLLRIPWSSLDILIIGAFAKWASGTAMHRKITRQSRWNLRRGSDRAIPNQAPETGGRRRDWMASILIRSRGSRPGSPNEYSCSDKRNFRRKIELLKILKPISEYRRGGQRPARLYRFAAARFEKLKDKGILFPF